MVCCPNKDKTIKIDLTGKMRRLFKNHIKYTLGLFATALTVALVLSGCGAQKQTPTEVPIPQSTNNSMQGSDIASNKHTKSVDLEVEDEAASSRMVSYDVTTIGRSDPFMPYNEMIEYQKAKASAIAEANARNAEVYKYQKMQNYSIREQDDISPYKFNLPVPPTSLDTHTFAAKITKTKVVGIMYNVKSPSAIINVDEKDYLVRPGDKIIGQEYKIVKITPTWVTAAMGSNVYSAAIGELFSKDGVETNHTDIYNLKERFGGRKI